MNFDIKLVPQEVELSLVALNKITREIGDATFTAIKTQAEPQAMNEEIDITLELNSVNVLLASLDELPRRISNPVYTKIAQQAVAQEQAAQQAQQVVEEAKSE